jgi:hypothetical protein
VPALVCHLRLRAIGAVSCLHLHHHAEKWQSREACRTRRKKGAIGALRDNYGFGDSPGLLKFWKSRNDPPILNPLLAEVRWAEVLLLIAGGVVGGRRKLQPRLLPPGFLKDSRC